jgi:hypothetical protein
MYDCTLRIMLKLIIRNCRDIITIKVLDDFFQGHVAGFHVEKVDHDELEGQEAAVEDVILPADVVKCLLFVYLVSMYFDSSFLEGYDLRWH